MGRNQRHRLRSRRARARIALALCVLWVSGFEVLPWLHIATHAHVGKHHHDESGAIIRDDETTEDEHDHHHGGDHDDLDAEIDEHAGHASVAHDDDEDAEVDEHGAPVDQDHDLDGEVDEHGAPVHHRHTHHESQESRDKQLRDAIGHGRHSLAHHDVATTRPPPVLTEPLPIDRRPIFLFEDTAIEPYSFSPGRAVARGPPPQAFES